MKKRFVFLLMGGHYDPEKHQARFETERQITDIFTVRNFEEACARMLCLDQEGVGAVELCGAFGEDGARKLIQLTGSRIAVGYVVHRPEQDSLFDRFFSGFNDIK